MSDTRTTEEIEILKARAVALAEIPGAESRAEGVEVLAFRLGAETYGIESSYVREVYPVKEYTPLPGTPDFVLGITSVRGEVFSIMDLRRFFGLPGQATGEPGLVAIVRSGDMQVAIVADSILDVRALPSSDIQPPPATLAAGCAPYVRGVTPERVTLLDIGKLLGDPAIICQD